ncbi:MAG: hypothetical protein LBS75_03525 [Synergistaceae bacterium]|nr:hypothetical protein [Synergistaceae bacterium]
MREVSRDIQARGKYLPQSAWGRYLRLMSFLFSGIRAVVLRAVSVFNFLAAVGRCVWYVIFCAFLLFIVVFAFYFAFSLLVSMFTG